MCGLPQNYNILKGNFLRCPLALGCILAEYKSNMSAIIEVSHLSKHYSNNTAVDDISFAVNPGEIFGFLGQNGAGKSTTIRMLLTLVRPSAGHIEMFGLRLQSFRKRILKRVGAIIERPDLYGYLTGYENLSLFARMSGTHVPESEKMRQLELVGLKERAHDQVKTYSQGMKQRLGIAVALVHNPELVILDEPTNGLDPQGIADVRNLILHLSRNEHKTIFLSSHLLNEIEMVADRMVILDRGKKIIEGAVGELFDPQNMVVELKVTDPERAYNHLGQSRWKDRVKEKRGPVVFMQMARDEVPDFARHLVEAGFDILSLHSRYSLESYFLSLITANRHVEAPADRVV